MASPWPESDGGLLNLAKLQINLRTGVERRLVEQQETLERHARDCSRAAEDSALSRAEAAFAPQVSLLGAKVQAVLDTHCAQLRSLEERAIRAESRLGALEAQVEAHIKRSDSQFAEAAKCRAEMQADVHNTVSRLDAQDAAQERRLGEIEAAWNARMLAASEAAAILRQTDVATAAAHLDQARSQFLQMFGTCMTRITALDDRSEAQHESVLDCNKALEFGLRRQEEETTATASWTRCQFDECRANDDWLRQAVGDQHRDWHEALARETREQSVRLESSIQSLADKTLEGFADVRSQAKELHEDHNCKLHATADTFHSSLTQHRAALGAETDVIHRKCADSEAHMERLITSREQHVLKAMEQRVTAAASFYQRDLGFAQLELNGEIQDLRREVNEEARRATQGMEHGIAEARAECAASTNTAVGEAVATLRSELEKSLQDVGRRLEGFAVNECERALRESVRVQSRQAYHSETA